MEADADRKPVAALCAPTAIVFNDNRNGGQTQNIVSPEDDLLFAAAHRMRIQDEAQRRLRAAELDEEYWERQSEEDE